jgi:hypothetical protein
MLIVAEERDLLERARSCQGTGAPSLNWQAVLTSEYRYMTLPVQQRARSPGAMISRDE